MTIFILSPFAISFRNFQSLTFPPAFSNVGDRAYVRFFLVPHVLTTFFMYLTRSIPRLLNCISNLFLSLIVIFFQSCPPSVLLFAKCCVCCTFLSIAQCSWLLCAVYLDVPLSIVQLSGFLVAHQIALI